MFLLSLDWQLYRPISGLLYPTANGRKGFVCVSLSWVTDKERDETLIGFTMCRSHLLLLERRGGGLRNPTGIYFFFLFLFKSFQPLKDRASKKNGSLTSAVRFCADWLICTPIRSSIVTSKDRTFC